MRASQEGHVEISKLLLVSGADVNRKNHEGMNALMLASQRGHAEMVLLLIKTNATMDEQTSQVIKNDNSISLLPHVLIIIFFAIIT